MSKEKIICWLCTLSGFCKTNESPKNNNVEYCVEFTKTRIEFNNIFSRNK